MKAISQIKIIYLLLKELENPISFGLCGALEDVWYRGQGSFDGIEVFQELMEKRAIDAKVVQCTIGYWWPKQDRRSRINFLKSWRISLRKEIEPELNSEERLKDNGTIITIPNNY